MLKTNRKKVNLNIQRLTEQRLLDSKLLKPKASPLTSLGLVAVALGILLAGGLFGYYYFSKTPLEPASTPEIIVPEEASTQEQSEATTTPVITEPSVKLREVEILETPTGFLNVRSGPGTNFEKIGQVKPGESFEFVSENPERTWLEIKLPDGTIGWVTGQYAKVN